MRKYIWFLTALAAILVLCALFTRHMLDERAELIEMYPWLVNPIQEDTKAALCSALDLSPDNEMCIYGAIVNFDDIVSEIELQFTLGETSYAIVEEKLGSFPHKREQSIHPEGHITSLRYAYQLTEYPGACVYFYINLDDLDTVDDISTTDVSDGPLPERCLRNSSSP